MTKAYDFGELVDRLKDKGLDLAEEAVQLVAEELLVWVNDSAVISENKYDDLLIALLPLLKDEIFKYVDRIDGEVDQMKA